MQVPESDAAMSVPLGPWGRACACCVHAAGTLSGRGAGDVCRCAASHPLSGYVAGLRTSQARSGLREKCTWRVVYAPSTSPSGNRGSAKL